MNDPDRGTASPVNGRLCLLGGWHLEQDGVSARVSRSAQRLIALVALRGPCERSVVVGTLWPEFPEGQAATNLRSALHRVQQRVPGVLTTAREELGLNPTVTVDVDVLSRGPDVDDDAQWTSLAEASRNELLPGWYEDWVLQERERVRQLWLHALERRAAALAGRRDYERALDAALLVARAEPMRESPQRLIMRIHLAEGNVSEAIRTYLQYDELMRRELGVRPSRLMADLLGGVGLDVSAPAHRPPALHAMR